MNVDKHNTFTIYFHTYQNMGTIERLNYLINDVESVLSRNALKYKLFNNGLLIEITPDANFGNVSTISFTFTKPSGDKVSKEYAIDDSVFQTSGDDLATKVLLFSDNLSKQDINSITKYYNDEETSNEQKIINYFTTGLGNLISVYQLIIDQPLLFSPYSSSVSLPVPKFDVSLLSQSLIDYVDGHLFNISQSNKVSQIARVLARNAYTFTKYFKGMFIPGSVSYDITKAVQTSMRDFKNITYNPDEILNSHVTSLERSKLDILEEIRGDVEAYKQELRDLYLNPQYDNGCGGDGNGEVENIRQAAIADITSYADEEIGLIKKESLAVIKYIDSSKAYIEGQVEEARSILDQVNSADTCRGDSLTADEVNEMIKSQVSSIKMTTTPSDVTKMNALNDKLDKEVSRLNTKITRIEKMLDTILKFLKC